MKFPLSPNHFCLCIYTHSNILIFTVISIADTNIFAVNDIPTAKMASKTGLTGRRCFINRRFRNVRYSRAEYTLRGWKFNYRWIGLWIGFFRSDWQAIWISPEGGAEKYNRKTFTAKRLRSFEFGFALFEAFDTPVSAASQNTNQFSKSSQSMLNFQPRRV